MSRSVQVTTPSDQTEGVVEQVRQVDGLISLRVLRGISMKPPGDVIELEVTDRSLHALIRLLDEAGVGRGSGTSLMTSTPTSLVSSDFAEEIPNDRSEWSWEEMEVTIARESNMTANGLATMGVSGVVAVIGIATGSLHLVIGAMVIAPGFEPLTRIALGLVAGSPAWRRGLWHATLAYLAMVLAAVVTALVLQWLGRGVLGDRSTYLTSDALVSYWSTISWTSLAASAAASVGGAILIAAGRALLTGGVMVALALIPSATLAAMALVEGDWALGGRAALRWLIDAALVVAISALVLGWKRYSIQRRKAML